ncbi:MAG: IPExxxVDY family protein [bacterium]
MAKKLKLEVDYFEGYHMFSIATQSKDYTLAFHINHALNIELKKYDDLTVEGRKGTYPWFYFTQGQHSPTFYLIGNNHSDGKIIPTQKGIDYYLLIRELFDNEMLSHYAAALRKIPGILGVFITNMKNIRHLDLLIESVELHEMETVARPGKIKQPK